MMTEPKTSRTTWSLIAVAAVMVLVGGLGLLGVWLKPLLPPEDREFPVGSLICVLLATSVGALVGGVSVGYLGARQGERVGDQAGCSTRGIFGLFGGGLVGSLVGMLAGAVAGLIAGLLLARLLVG
jgi:hypothetical protein